MSYIKGQNLRLIIGTPNNQRCIAAAKTATISINTQISDHSTKDTTGNWVENKVDSLSWEVTAEALVTDKYMINETVNCTQQSGDLSLYAYPQGFNLCDDDSVHAACADETVELYIMDSNGNILAQGEGAVVYTATGDIQVMLMASSNTADIDFIVQDNSGHNLQTLFNAMKEGTSVSVEVATTDGGKNRTEDSDLLDGLAVITSLSVNTPNRQDSTLSITMTGISELLNQW